jgi:hypothetical protein
MVMARKTRQIPRDKRRFFSLWRVGHGRRVNFARINILGGVCTMTDSNGQALQNAGTKEFQFSKVKGFGSINYGSRISKVTLDDTHLSVESVRKIFFVKGKPKTDTAEYSAIDKVEVRTNFAKGDFISAIICLILTIAFWEENGFYGVFVVALLVFCSYGKNIIVTKKDKSKIVIMSEGIGAKKEIVDFCGILNEKIKAK